ncbi:30S ribosomal protein S1 [Alphaproteobacteria bacterium]|nr:30S ribosomal protein S1 [Alphaproteobacteria bacterium]
MNPPNTQENFADLLNEYLSQDLEGTVVSGRVVAVDDEFITIDVGLKSEGRVSRREFGSSGEIKVGQTLDVFIDRYEDKEGNVVLSREKARREEAWKDLELSCQKGEKVTGTIFGRVKGGFTVDLSGATAFLPGSQVDIRPVRDVGPMMDVPQEFVILKMDRARGNIVVSRRAVLEESRTEQRSEIIKNLAEGQIIDGVVKNITDYGAFVDLGGVDGLLHVTDISWKRINHPSEVLHVGETIRAQIIRFNQETQRISLGLKQLESDPWVGVGARYRVGQKVKGTVTNVADYGAFVELETGIEGLIHVSEMSWTKKNIHPGKILSASQEVEATVLDVDEVKRRISLGLKQSQPNPWQAFAENHPAGSIIEGEVKTITEFALFVGIDNDIDGMVHLSDISYDQPGEEAVKAYRKGDMVKVKVLDIDLAKERVALGIKQLTGGHGGSDSGASEGGSAAGAGAGGYRKGAVVQGVVVGIADGGIEVSVADWTGFIKRSDLALNRDEQRPETFAKGDKVEAKVILADKKTRKLTLSIRAKELDEEKEAVREYGQSDSGASLGDILGAALDKAESGKAKK